MLPCKTFWLSSTCDHLQLSGAYVMPSCPPIAMVQLVHGMAEHKERYYPFMYELAKNGYGCVILDQRGHGGSVKTQDDLGYFYDATAHYIIEDNHQLTLAIKEKLPQIPVILFGHSMGSLVVRGYAKRYDEDIDGLIVCGSPSKNPMAKSARLLVKAMCLFKGDHYRSKWIHHLAFASYAKRFKETYSENVWLSKKRSNVEAYDGDPACGFIFTLNGFLNLFTLMSDAYDTHGYRMHAPQLPILFVAGSEDPCMDNVKKFHAAVKTMASCGYLHIQQHLFQGLRHEILQEDTKEDVYAYIIDWIQRVIQAKGTR